MVLHAISLYCMALYSITRGCLYSLYSAPANYLVVHLVILYTYPEHTYNFAPCSGSQVAWMGRVDPVLCHLRWRHSEETERLQWGQEWGSFQANGHRVRGDDLWRGCLPTSRCTNASTLLYHMGGHNGFFAGQGFFYSNKPLMVNGWKKIHFV